MSIQVVILAGGMGTRIKSVAGDLPKALIPVADKPFILHQFELLKKNGLTDVLLLTGYRGEMIEDVVGDGSEFGMHVDFVQEDPDSLLGTGGALLNAKDKLADAFMTLYGDSYLPVDYRAMAEWYQAQQRPAVMSVYFNRGQWDHSNVRIDGDRVAYYDKTAKEGEADYIDYGLSILTRDIVESYAEAPMPLDMAVILMDLVQKDKLAAYEVSQRFYEIGKPSGLEELDQLLRNNSDT